MIATLELVELRRGGGVLTAAVTTGATVLPLDLTLDYDEAGGLLELGGEVYTYTAVGDDFVTLASGVLADAEIDTPAWTVDAEGNREETWIAWVDLDDNGDTVPASIPTSLIGYFPEGDVAAGQDVEVEATADGYRVANRPDQAPVLDGSVIDPTSTIPGGQAFSLDAPTATDGYPEDYGWWQVDAGGKVLGFWRLIAGVWTAQTIVTQAALQVGNILVDALTGETITGVTITGSTVQTATSGARWKMTSASANELLGYTGGANETTAARINVGTGPNDYYMQLYSPVRSGVTNIAQLQLITSPTEAVVQVFGDKVFVSGSSSIDLSATSINFTGEARWTAATANSWTTYTPTFTAATTNPTLGSFTRAGRWSQWGKTIRFSIVITATAASGYGSGTYEFGLPPVAARNADEIVVTAAQTGPNHGYIGRSSGGSTSAITLTLTSTDAAINATNSGMANGTVLRITGTYEAA